MNIIYFLWSRHFEMKIMWMILGLCLVAGVFAEPAADLEDGIVEVEDDGLDVNILGENQDRKLPKTQEELMEMLESLKGATDEEKEKFMNSIGGKDVKQTSGGSGGFLYQTFTLLGLLSIIGCIFSNSFFYF